MDKAGIMGFAPPFRGTGTGGERWEAYGLAGLVPDKVSLVHFDG